MWQPDRVMEFCKNNDLQLIVRAHECVMDGFERFAQGHLITLFSATNYCGECGGWEVGGMEEVRKWMGLQWRCGFEGGKLRGRGAWGMFGKWCKCGGGLGVVGSSGVAV